MKKLFLFIVIITCISSFAQSVDTAAIASYLKQNMEVVAIGKNAEIKIFDNAFYNNKLFLFGENHGSANPQLLDIMLFKQVYKNAGVRYYIAEVDDTKAWLLNSYLKTGNEVLLKKVFSSWIADTLQWANESNYTKFKQLHLWYKTLSAKEKFTIVGIDYVQDYSLLKEHTQHLLSTIKTKNKPLYLDSLSTITDTIKYSSRKALGSFARHLLVQMQIDKSTEISAEFKHYITSLSFIGAGMYRDSIMSRNLQSIVSHYTLQNKKMYGFLGFYHCLQSSYEKSMAFAGLLQKNDPSFSNKIASIQMMGLQSKTLLPYTAQIKMMMPATYVEKLRQENPDFVNSKKYVPYDLSNDNSMMKIEGIDFLNKITTPNSTTLFKLNSTNSPFFSSKLLAEVTGFQSIKLTNSTTTTAQSFQYIVLFRDSKAGIPIE